MYGADGEELPEPTEGGVVCSGGEGAQADADAAASNTCVVKPRRRLVFGTYSGKDDAGGLTTDDDDDDEPLQPMPDLDADIEPDEEEFPYELVDDDSDFSRQELGPRWTGERRVSFPSPDRLAVYQEPEDDDFNLSEILTPEELLEKYKSSCQRNQTVQLESITEQLREIRLNINRSAVLRLNMNITVEVCETVEDIFKITNFQRIVLNHCTFTGNTAFEFINMIEYYEPTTELEITSNFGDLDLWKAFCTTLEKTHQLEAIIFTNMNLDEIYIRYLMTSLNVNPKISKLQFKACTLTKAPSFYLVDPLMMNNTLRELHLNQIGMFTRETDCLSKFLSRNSYLKVLNLSNNSIGDRGLEVLARGLFTRTPDMGVCTLVICNNQITEKSAPTVAAIIRDNKNLRLINLGYNPLTDSVLEAIEPVLGDDIVLEALGLQATLITDAGAQCLARGLEENTSLRRLNLKCNKAIQLDGLEALCNALTRCRVVSVEIDESNRTCHDVRYDELVRQIKGICSVNEKNYKCEAASCVSEKIARRVTLECDQCQCSQPPYLATACSGQPNVQLGQPNVQLSQPTNSRFQVSRVRDMVSSSQRSNVVQVPVQLDAAEGGGNRFQGLRSSISSSTDSIESLSAQAAVDDSVLTTETD